MEEVQTWRCPGACVCLRVCSVLSILVFDEGDWLSDQKEWPVGLSEDVLSRSTHVCP